MDRVLVVIDTIANNPSPSWFELISFAERFSETFPLDIRVVVAGANVKDPAEKAARFGHDVIGLYHESFLSPNPDLLAKAVSSLIEEIRPRYICFQHTMRGCQTAALLSVRHRLSCITAVEAFRGTETGPGFRRSIFNGKINIDLSPSSERTVLTVLPGAFAGGSASLSGNPGVIDIRSIPGIDSTCTPIGTGVSAEETIRLEDSDVIVSAGRGIGSQENLELIRTVSRIFSNSSVGASRILCDQKWLPYAHQVGVTGRTVAPKLYLACGISGAQQHIAGMKGSQLIVSINTDPQAAIFSISDYIVIEDLTTFLPVLIQKHEEHYKKP